MSKLRFYYGTDANFIISSGYSIQIINEKRSNFEAFSIHFTPGKLQELNDLYDQITTIPSDKVFINILAEASHDVKIEHDICCEFFQHSKIDIEMAFPNDELVWNQFGFNDYEKARKSPGNMFIFLTDFDTMAVRYKDTLLVNGWTEGKFATILEHRDKLKAAMNRQNNRILERRRATENRVEILNKLYEKLALYFKAAQIIFEENENLLKRFRFPIPSSLLRLNNIEEEVISEGTID